MIDSVTSDHINKAINHLLKNKPTMVVTGNAVNIIPSVADIQGRLR
jgi:translation initiation factor 2B subunit (eIF-2B alpha/beta/delta family)